MENINHQYLKHVGEYLENYFGHCGSLAREVRLWANERGIEATEMMISIDNHYSIRPKICLGGITEVWWSYHVVLEVEGKIHDPWYPDILNTKLYMKRNFGHHRDVRILEH